MTLKEFEMLVRLYKDLKSLLISKPELKPDDFEPILDDMIKIMTASQIEGLMKGKREKEHKRLLRMLDS